jgi:hypothetical protein
MKTLLIALLSLPAILIGQDAENSYSAVYGANGGYLYNGATYGSPSYHWNYTYDGTGSPVFYTVKQDFNSMDLLPVR